MACKECDNSPVVIPVRVDNANVTLLACKQHGARLIELLRLAHGVEERAKADAG